MTNTRHQVTEEPILAVLQQIPPIQTTRRFALQDMLLAGQPLLSGQSVLVHLKMPERSFAFGYLSTQYHASVAEPLSLACFAKYAVYC